ncbi:hypothetical protein [Cohnella thailandensis]|uniref:Uncharacterized protein n=1 Tax=Cohnella thailandensis TaxID=557557 RepID=A0A841SYY9_9BACL|nr:hypothetical protein [Cohnella thailandensis]MBB6633981.1 hypothetical protein [Cohnella thailandensis]MBP1972664.1 hypothetical protein [Cohnella thailandensis]
MGQRVDKRDWADAQFAPDNRLGIAVPSLSLPWERMSGSERIAVLEAWESIRGTIPDRIFEFERRIRELQDALFEEEDFVRSCRLNAAIAELASRINDLNIWYRTEQDFEVETRLHS